ncbi:MAG: polysaccharide pyruvyl transferase family protein [Bacteroidales bacterium]|mgnify:CR=1 FL=1|nr:polysaccharide pyruvyl transferase family protein [Bacteroidales bacterium]
MKIGILTQPLHKNYGGILQNYALQKVLKDMGHEVWTIDRDFNYSSYQKYASFIKRVLLKSFNRNIAIQVLPTKKQEEIILQHIRSFIKNNIQTTKKTISTEQLTQLHQKYAFDAYIVGSDQVWRAPYSPCLTNYFLDFIEYESRVKKIAYAASFGVDEWEFTEEQTKECARLAKQFHAISLREDSGVELCRKYFGVDAVHLLDPTLLLSKEDYLLLMNNKKTTSNKGDLFVYILDKDEKKNNIINEIAKHKNLIPFELLPKQFLIETNKYEIEKCIFPPIEQWLRAFVDAEFIITDSFHGTIFSIIFEKPFIVLGNKKRGLNRFISLLRIFSLKDRLIDEDKIDYSIIEQQINYSIVHNILNKKREESFSFLKKFL